MALKRLTARLGLLAGPDLQDLDPRTSKPEANPISGLDRRRLPDRRIVQEGLIALAQVNQYEPPRRRFDPGVSTRDSRKGDWINRDFATSVSAEPDELTGRDEELHLSIRLIQAEPDSHRRASP